MKYRNKLVFFLFFLFILNFFQYNQINFKSNSNLLDNLNIFTILFRFGQLNDKKLNSLNENYLKIEVYYVNLSKEGLVEIGESIEVESLYTLNFSPYKYAISENWIDISDYPESFHTLPYPVENLTYKRNVTLDPDRFEVNETVSLYGKALLKVIDLENSFIYTKQNISNNTIRISKTEVNYTITEQWPEIILSSKMTNVTFNFFNKHNDTFKFENSKVQFLLYDPNSNLIQNENLSTSINGDLSILLKTNSCEDGGNYSLKIITEETDYYKSTIHIINFFVYNETAFLNVSISDEEVYVSVPYDLKYLELSANVQYNSYMFWNSSFSSGEFIKIYNYSYLSNLTAPSCYNNYLIQVWAYPDKTNSSLNKNVSVNVIPRPINIKLDVKRKIITNEIEIKGIITDKISNHSIVNNEIFSFYIFSNSCWEFIGNKKSSNGEVCLTWKIPNNFSNQQFSFKVEITNSCIYEQTFNCKEIQITDLRVLTLPEIKINNFFPIFLMLQIKNSSVFSNENIQIYVNGLRIYSIELKPNNVRILLFLAPPYETTLNFFINYEGNNCNLNSYFIFQLKIRSDSIKIIVGNVGFFISILLCFIFSYIYFKNRSSNNLSRLKI